MAQDKNTENEVEVTETEVAEKEASEVAEAATETKPSKSEKASKEEKKPGVFARFGSLLKRFGKTMKSELKKITWYSRKQTFASTLLVLIVMAVAGVVIGLLDVGFSKGLEALAGLFKF